jgi:hypothetical protein
MRSAKAIHLLLISITCITLFSCGDQLKTGLETDPYFDLKGFVAQQAKSLDGHQVEKKSAVGNEEKKSEMIYSTQEWKDELLVFTSADINKPSLVQAYQSERNPTTLSHTLRPDSKDNVKSIFVEYDGEKVRRITIQLVEDDLFYSSTTKGVLVINIETKKLASYEIETTQKIWFLDSNVMKISGIIN